jgi:hypothetical protein
MVYNYRIKKLPRLGPIKAKAPRCILLAVWPAAAALSLLHLLYMLYTVVLLRMVFIYNSGWV